MISAADLVLFGLQAGLKLAQAGRQAYVEATALRGLVLPLPQGLNSPLSAARLHADNVSFRDPERYASAFSGPLNDSYSADPEERSRNGGILLELFLKDLAEGRVDGYGPEQGKGNAMRAGMFMVKQWQEEDKPFPSPLQRVGGALLEITIDYFIHVPGALDKATPEGKTVHSFLAALDAIDFQEDNVENIVVDLFTTAVQTASEYPALFTSNEATQAMIESVMRGVADASSVQWQTILAATDGVGDFTAYDKLLRFSKVVLRSSLMATGEALLTHEGAMDINNAGHRAVVQSVGASLLDLLLADTGEGLTYSFAGAIERTFSQDSLNKLALGAIRAVTEHPAIFAGINEAPIRSWLHSILQELYQGSEANGILFDDDLFVEIAYIILDQGIDHLPQLLSTEQKPLLASVSRALFTTIAKDAGGSIEWDFELTRHEVKTIFTSALQSIAAHPQWFARDEDGQALIAATTALLVDVLGKADSNLFKAIIRNEQLADVIEVVLNSKLGGKLHGATHTTVAQFLAQAIQGVTDQGKAGLKALLYDGHLEDLLSALADDTLLTVVLGDDTEAAAKLLDGISKIIHRMRQGEFFAIPELQHTLLTRMQNS